MRLVVIRDHTLKRLLDVVVAGVALLLLFPLIAAVAVAIKLESRGPVFYRCRRVGLGGREFAMLKFRKMRAAAAGSPLTAADDERFTGLGRLLARTKLDEIPQLWNVLIGRMSLVGPRPEDPSFAALWSTDFERILRGEAGDYRAIATGVRARERDPRRRRSRRRLRSSAPSSEDQNRSTVREKSVDPHGPPHHWLDGDHRPPRRDVAVNRSTGRITLRRTSATARAGVAPSPNCT